MQSKKFVLLKFSDLYTHISKVLFTSFKEGISQFGSSFIASNCQCVKFSTDGISMQLSLRRTRNQLTKNFGNDVLTGLMQQPQMNPNVSPSSQDGNRTVRRISK